MTKVVSGGLGLTPSGTREMARRVKTCKYCSPVCHYGKVAEAEKFMWKRGLFSTCLCRSKTMILACFQLVIEAVCYPMH